MTEYRTVTLPDVPESEMQYYYAANRGLQPQTAFPPHIHDCIEIYLLEEGDVSFLVEGHLYPLKPGDAILSRPNEIHNCILNSQTVHKHFCFWFRSDSEFLFGDFLRGKTGSVNFLSPATDELRAKILQTALEIYSLNGKDPLSEYAKTLQLISLWHRCLDGSLPDPSLPKPLQRILEDISDNLSAIHSLSYFTEKYYLSSSQLRRLFSQYLHVTPKAYLENKRLARSRTLLRNGSSVTEACMESGFPDLSNYIRTFRLRFGITPSEYQRSDQRKTDPVPNKYI